MYVKQVVDLRPHSLVPEKLQMYYALEKSIQQFTPFTFHGKSMIIYIMITNDLP